MATEKFSDSVPVETPAVIDDMTNLALVGVIHKGFIRLEMDEPESGEPVVVYESPKNEGTVELRQVGELLRIVAIAGEASVTVYEDS